MKDYTIIWLDSWMSGSHRHTLTQKTFVRCQDLINIMESSYKDTAIYIFEGHIPTIGEQVSEEDIEII